MVIAFSFQDICRLPPAKNHKKAIRYWPSLRTQKPVSNLYSSTQYITLYKTRSSGCMYSNFTFSSLLFIMSEWPVTIPALKYRHFCTVQNFELTRGKNDFNSSSKIRTMQQCQYIGGGSERCYTPNYRTQCLRARSGDQITTSWNGYRWYRHNISSLEMRCSRERTENHRSIQIHISVVTKNAKIVTAFFSLIMAYFVAFWKNKGKKRSPASSLLCSRPFGFLLCQSSLRLPLSLRPTWAMHLPHHSSSAVQYNQYVPAEPAQSNTKKFKVLVFLSTLLPDYFEALR